MKQQKSQRRSRSLYVRRQQASSVPPAHGVDSQRWPSVGRVATKEVISSATQSKTTHKYGMYDQSREHNHHGPSGYSLPPWGYAAGPVGYPTPYGSRGSNVVYPTPPTVAANSAPHYSRTFLLKQQAERDRDTVKRQQRLEV